MADIHIDDFCRDAALVLLHLYSVFPRRASVYVIDISGEDEPDEVGLHSDRFMACLGTMLWLAEEDFLRFEAMIYQEGIDQAVLTSKSFSLLSQVSDYRVQDPDDGLPHSIQAERLTMVEQIRAALSSGESDKITHIMRYFLSSTPRTVLPTSLATPPANPCAEDDETRH